MTGVQDGSRNAFRFFGALLHGFTPDETPPFIVSNTPSATMRMLWRMEEREMQKRHVLFQVEDKDSYVRTMLEATGAGGAAS